jgi:trigger factor
MSEVVQASIEAANKQIIDDNQLRLATQPRIELPREPGAIEAALEARGDLNFKIAVEVLPQFEVGEFSDLALEKLVAEVGESDVDRGIEGIVASRRAYAMRAEGEAAAPGDRLAVDFVGTIDGERFEGGTSENIQVLLGSKTFIPGFEEALIGAVAGERRAVKATFPENYARSHRRRSRTRIAREDQTQVVGRARRALCIRSAAGARRSGVQSDLDRGRKRAKIDRENLRGRRQDGGSRARGI